MNSKALLTQFQKILRSPTQENFAERWELRWTIIEQLLREGRRILALALYDAMDELRKTDNNDAFMEAVASILGRVNTN